MKQNIYYLGAVLVILHSITAFGTVSGPTELLPVIADSMDHYLNRINTWKGTAEHQHYTFAEIKGTPYEDEGTHQISFLVDQDHNYAWSSFLSFSAEKEEKSLPFYSEGVSLKEKVYYMLPYKTHQEASPRVLLILLQQEEEKFSPGIGNSFYNPHRILQKMIDYLPEMYRMKYQHIKTNSVTGCLRVSQEQGLITIYTSLDTQSNFGLAEIRCVLDPSKGYVIVERQDTNSLQKEIWRVIYKPFRDMFLPSEITYFYESSVPEKRLYRSNLKIKTEMLNEPVSESERVFSFEKMGLRKGDWIVDDTMGGLRYQWDPNTAESK